GSALSGAKYTGQTKESECLKYVVERIQVLPGVQFAGATRELPESFPRRVAFEVADQPFSRAEDRPLAANYVISPDYFRVMRIPFLKGRQFSLSDGAGTPKVIIVNQTFVKRFFPKTDPIGVIVHTYPDVTGAPDSREIAGVVGDVIDRVGQSKDVAQMYVPFLQNPLSAMVVVMRGGDPGALAPALRELVWAMDKDQ